MILGIEKQVEDSLKSILPGVSVSESTGGEITPPAVVLDHAGTTLIPIKPREAYPGFLPTVYDRVHRFDITVYSARGKDYTAFDARVDMIFNQLPFKMHNEDNTRGYEWDNIEPDDRDETRDKNTRSITLPFMVVESGVNLTGG